MAKQRKRKAKKRAPARAVKIVKRGGKTEILIRKAAKRT
jgi:hypothetical protein